MDKYIHNLITEALSGKNQPTTETPVNSITGKAAFDDNYVSQMQKSSRANSMVGSSKQIMKTLALAFGAGALASMCQMSGMGIFTLVSLLGVPSLIRNIAQNAAAWQRVQSMSFPNNANVAKQCAIEAAKNRAIAQQNCIAAQTNFNNALYAFNIVFQQDKSWNDISAANKKTSFKVQNGGTEEVAVQADRDFTDRYTGQNESKRAKTVLKEAFNGQIETKSREDYQHEFMQQQNEAAAWAVVEAAAQLYKQQYGIWMQWTRYINVLVHKFKSYGLTWEYALSPHTKVSSMAGDAIQKIKTSMGFQPSQRNDSPYQPQNASQTIDLVLISTQWSPGYRNSAYYWVFKQPKTNAHFAIQVPQNSAIQCRRYETYTLVYSPNLVYTRAKDSKGTPITILVDDAYQYLANK